MSTSERAPQGAAIPRTLGDRLAKARKMAGLSFIEMHAKTGMARNSMPRYEADQTTRPIRSHTIMAYAMATHRAFGLEPYQVFEWLVSGDSTQDVPAENASNLRSKGTAWTPLRSASSKAIRQQMPDFAAA